MSDNNIRNSPSVTQVRDKGADAPAANVQKADPGKLATVLPAVQAQSAHSMAIAEAMDGDASEAIALAANGQGRRTSTASGDGETEQKVEDVKAGPRLQRKLDKPAADHKKPEDASQAANGTSKIESVAVKSKDLRSSHDKLMVISQTMDRKDLGTFIAKQHAERLEGIFSGDLWKPKSNATDQLTGLQVAQAAPAA